MPELFIVGKGAVGLLLAERLAQTYSVTLITRSPTQTVFAQHAECTRPLEVKCLSWQELAKQGIRIDLCIVPVKSYQLSAAFAALRPHLSPGANVIFSHNGIQALEPVTAELSVQQGLFFLSTSMGGWKPDANTVAFTGPGLSVFGPCNTAAQQRASSLFDTLISPHLVPAQLSDDIARLRWQKLCVNLAINPLSALSGLKNGRLRAPCYASKVLGVLSEACTVANHVGVPLKLHEELHRAYQVMTLTADNFSSMAQDVKHQRRTEIDAMCGYIVELANQYGLSVPHNMNLLASVRALHPVENTAGIG
ncbi:2-dehydropantoate 2-reductase [Pseudoalteromonas sp. R3]|uniref:ketopantoate reductase family protein n=1 Tax=Pseudoalteromonas sp. R3 TaxID=1709477 RepID=UPI0006B653A6|nr:2-dehydropantoate 2-reductase [Pseudoalteromonas sp. R3]AZZ96975.1 2-dehydropantoate 2-reductase [Pseudoalteromonas sp. R3]